MFAIRHFLSLGQLFFAGLIVVSVLVPDIDGTANAQPLGVNDEAVPPDVEPLPFLASQRVGDTPGSGRVEGGAYLYSIPIDIPQGRAGMNPSLSLNYHSQGGNGLLGVGWNISGLSMITRCGKTLSSGYRKNADDIPGREMAGVQFDDTDNLCLDGEQLALVEGAYLETGSEYRTQFDRFAKIVASNSSTRGVPRTFTVYHKNGLIGTYTAHGASRRQLRVNGEVASTTSVTVAWPLTRLRDRAGNFITYNWAALESGGGVLVIDSITYTHCSGCEYGSTTGWSGKVDFVLENDPRPDVIDGYVNGVRLRTSKRLAAVEVWSNKEGTGETRIRRYQLDYKVSGASGRSLVASVQLCDSGDVCVESKEFTWQGESGMDYTLKRLGSGLYQDPLVKPGFGDSPEGEDREVNAAEVNYQLMDANGDGNLDVVLKKWPASALADDGRLYIPEAEGSVLGAGRHVVNNNAVPLDMLLLGDGKGYFKPAVAIDPEADGNPTTSNRCSQAEITDIGEAMVVDLDGDGRDELVAPVNKGCPFYSPPLSAAFRDRYRISPFYSPVEFPATSSSRVWMVLAFDPNRGTLTERRVPDISGVQWGRTQLAFSDLNGDGLPDLMRRDLLAENSGWQAYQAVFFSFPESDPPALMYIPDGLFTNLSNWPANTVGLRRPSPYRTLDLDADGLQEFLQLSNDGSERSYSLVRTDQPRWQLRNDGSNIFQDFDFDGVSLDTEWGEPTTSFAGGRTRARHYIDINGDGLRDLLYVELPPPNTPGSRPLWRLRINTGAGFLPPASTGAGAGDLNLYLSRDASQLQGERVDGKDLGLRIADVNGDGMQDLVLLEPLQGQNDGETVTGEIRVQYGNGVNLSDTAVLLDEGLRRLHRIGSVQAWPHTKVEDINGDGVADIVDFEEASGGQQRKLYTYSSSLAGGIDLITEVSDGRGRAEEIAYDQLAAGTRSRIDDAEADTHVSDTGMATDFFASFPGVPCEYPATCLAKGSVVRSYTNLRSEGEIDFRYFYRGARMNRKSGGSLGFRVNVILDKVTGQRTTHFFDQSRQSNAFNDPLYFDAYPNVGTPKVSLIEMSAEGAATRTAADLEAPRETGRLIRYRETRHAGYPLRLVEETVTELVQDQIIPDETTVAQDLRYYLTHPYGVNQATHTTTRRYDRHGNLTDQTLSSLDLQSRDGLDGLELRQSTEIEYAAADEAAWLIGQSVRETTTFTTNDPGCGGLADCAERRQTMEFGYDDNGMLQRIVREPDGASSVKLTTTLERDTAGLVRTIRTADSGGERVEKMDFNADGSHVRASENAMGHVSWQLYDSLGLDTLLAATSADGASEYYQYDRLGRLRQTVSDTGATQQTSYGRNHVDTESNNGAKSRVYFDLRGRPYLTASLAYNASVSAFAERYDALGQTIETSYSRLPWTYANIVGGLAESELRQRHEDRKSVVDSAVYDVNGRLVKTSKGTGNLELTVYEYDSFGDVTQYDQLMNPVRKITDAHGLPRRIVHGSGREQSVTDYVYNAFGQLAGIRVDGELRKRLEYDDLGRLTTSVSIDADGSESLLSSQAYSAFDEVLQTRGLYQANYTYDALGRALEIDHLNTPGSISYQWDDRSTGQLSRAITTENPYGGRHETVYTYDAAGRVIEIANLFENQRLTVGFVYNSEGELARVRYPETDAGDRTPHSATGGLTIHYNRFANGQVARVCAGPCNNNSLLWRINSINPVGQILRATNGDGLVSNWSYHPNTLRLTNHRVEGVTSGPVPEQVFAYTVSGLVDYRESAGVGEDYAYDSHNRLIRYTRRNTRSGPMRLVDAEYHYDARGALREVDTGTSYQSPDWPLTRDLFTYGDRASTVSPWTNGQLWDDLLARVSSEDIETGQTRAVSLRHDSTGRLRRAGNYRLDPADAYNGFNLPTRIQARGGVYTFGYDAFGNRVSKTRDGNPSQNVIYIGGFYEAQNYAEASEADGRVTQSLYRVFLGDMPIAEITHDWASNTRKTRYPHTDHQGSVTFVTEGTASTQYGYFPFGRRWGEGEQEGSFASIGYTGHRHDDDIGVINMNGRIYDPALRRFLSPDPVMIVDAMAGTNPYIYVGNNPTNRTDPSGFCDAGYDDLNNGCSDPVTVSGDGGGILDTLEDVGCAIVGFLGVCDDAEDNQRDAQRRLEEDERRRREYAEAHPPIELGTLRHHGGPEPGQASSPEAAPPQEYLSEVRELNSVSRVRAQSFRAGAWQQNQSGGYSAEELARLRAVDPPIIAQWWSPADLLAGPITSVGRAGVSALSSGARSLYNQGSRAISRWATRRAVNSMPKGEHLQHNVVSQLSVANHNALTVAEYNLKYIMEKTVEGNGRFLFNINRATGDVVMGPIKASEVVPFVIREEGKGIIISGDFTALSSQARTSLMQTLKPLRYWRIVRE